jgi:hypothetical protein
MDFTWDSSKQAISSMKDVGLGGLKRDLYFFLVKLQFCVTSIQSVLLILFTQTLLSEIENQFQNKMKNSECVLSSSSVGSTVQFWTFASFYFFVP